MRLTKGNWSYMSSIPEPENPYIMRITKTVVFALIFIGLLNLFSYLFMEHDEAYLKREVYGKLKPNTVEIMFIGNSHSFCTFAPNIIEKATGKMTFNASMPSQSLDMVYYNLLYQLKTQNPKVIVLEAFAFQGKTKRDVFNDSNIYSMKYGFLKLSAIFNIYSDYKDRSELLFSLYRDHINWNKLNLSNEYYFYNNIKWLIGKYKVDDYTVEAKGFYELDSRMLPQTAQKFRYLEECDKKYKASVSQYDVEYFYNIVDECNKRNIRLVTVMAPLSKAFIDNIDYSATYKSFSDLCYKNKIDYIDYNMLHEKLGLQNEDFEDACHNAQHVNKYGAEKISKDIGQYLAKAQN